MESRFKRVIRRGLYVGAAVLAINAIRLTIPLVRAQSISPVPSGVAVVPYTVALTETVVSPDGRRMAAPAQTQAIRSDGARLIKNGEGDKSSRHLLFPSGIEVEVSDFLQAKSTTQKPVQGSWLLDPKADCARTVLGAVAYGDGSMTTLESVAGYRAAKIVSGVTTRWLALDHGCAPLKRIIDWGEKGSSELTLVSLIPGEPSSALFSTPDSYREGPPSAFAPPPDEKCSASCRESQRAHLERLDRAYYRYRPQ